MTVKSLIGAVLATAMLTACGTEEREFEFGEIRAAILREKPTPPTAAETADLVGKALAASNQPLMLATFEDLETSVLLVPLEQNGSVVTWSSQDIRTMSFRGDVLTASRGFLNDLMSAETRSVAAALRGNGGTVNRSWETLDSANNVVITQRSCRIVKGDPMAVPQVTGGTSTADRFDEVCEGAPAIRNVYLVDRTGRILQSRQWLGPAGGYLTLQLVRR